MRRNVSTSLRRRRRPDPMQAYDDLPRSLRAWMAQAALPWSPASCRRIWVKARAKGARPEDILDRLEKAERTALSNDRLSCTATNFTSLNDQKDQTV